MTERIPDEKLIQEIKRLADNPDNPPKMDDMDKDGKYGTTTYSSRWGTWNKSLKKAGFEPNREVGISDEDLLNEIQRLANGSDNPPTEPEVAEHGKYGTTIYTRRWGTWNEAIKAAGFTPNREVGVSKQKLVREIQRLAEGPDSPPMKNDMIENGNYSPGTFARRWGTWNEAVREAGYEPNSHRHIPETELKMELNRLAEEYEQIPSMKLMATEGKFSPDVYADSWGSWNDALCEVGLTPARISDIPREKLLDEIQRLATESETPPTQRDMKKRGRYSISPYRNQWGPWNSAVKAAGFEPNEEHDIDRDDLLDEIQRLANQFGRAPKYPEMDEYGKYSTMAYRNNFHSWWVAVVRAGCKPQGRRVLTPEQFHRFFNAASAMRSRKPRHSIVGLLFQFTGITVPILSELSESWLQFPGDQVIVSIPGNLTSGEGRWELLIPKTWKNPYSGETEPTTLPGLLDWYFTQNSNLGLKGYPTLRRVVHKIGANAELEDLRETVEDSKLGTVPRISSQDLRVTHGIHLVRNNAPEDVINRRMGLNHTDTAIDIEELKIWVEENNYS